QPEQHLTDGDELARGALTTTVAIFLSNFRGVFTFLVARLAGGAALGIFSVAFASTELLSKLGILGLDSTVTTFIARSRALGRVGEGGATFRRGLWLAVGFSAALAGLSVVAVRTFG